MNRIISSLRELCIKNNWFNAGTNSQYDKMFGFAEGLFQTADREQTVHRLADVIWICSEGADVVDIHKGLYNWYDEYRKGL